MSSREFLTGYRLRAFGMHHGDQLGREERKGWEHADRDAQAGERGPFAVLAYLPNPGGACLPYVVAQVDAVDRFHAARVYRVFMPELNAFKIAAQRLTPPST